MKAKTIVPLVIGLAVGFFAIKMGLDMVQKAKGASEDKAIVLVSSKSIETAAAITEPMLAAKEVPVSLVPQDSFRDRKQLVGRVTKLPIPPGMPITKTMLAPPGATPGLSAQIPAGCRAVSVKVTEESAVAGFLTPGSRVDVYAVSNRNGGGGGKNNSGRSRLVLSNVEIGAVGQSLNKTGADGKKTDVAKTVTLFLKPEEIQQLNSASGDSRGGLRLALRGADNDPGESFFAAMLKRAMERDEEPKPAKHVKPHAAPAKTHDVEVHRGKAFERLEFDGLGNVRHVQITDAAGTPVQTLAAAPQEHPAQPAPGTGTDDSGQMPVE